MVAVRMAARILAATRCPMNEAVDTPAPRRIPSWVPQALGYLLSAACLAWVLHGYPIGKLAPDIRSLEWKWVALAIVTDLAVYVCHGWRWVVLLEPVRKLGLWRTVQAVYIGLFANEVLPLRTGEVIRCYLLSQWNGLRLSVVFASAALERLLDGFWILVAFLITASYVKGIPLPLVRVVQGLGVLVVLGAALLLYTVLHKHHAHSLIGEHRWAATLRHIVEGLHVMGKPRCMARTSAVSVLYLVLQILSVYALMRAYGLDLSIWVAAGVLTLVRFGTVIPNAPGNLGMFQAACVVGLGLFEVERNDAKTFSFIMFFALTLPLLVGGAVAVARTGLNLGEIHRQARAGAQAAGDLPAAAAD